MLKNGRDIISPWLKCSLQ